MSAINEGIYERMANDATLTGYISTYNGAPAIFTVDPVPTDAELPFITANEDIVAVPWDTKTKQGRDFSRNIRAYTEATGSRVLLDDIAERIRFLFHRQADQINIDGYKVIICDVQGPEFVATDPRAYGLELEVRFVIQEL